MVYRSETDVLSIYSSFAQSAPSTEAFLAALASLTQPVASEDAAADAYALTVAPNPVADRGPVTFELSAAADVRVALYDALGRDAALLADAPYGSDRHSLVLATGDLPTGVYMVHAQLGDTARTMRLTVVR